jgi:hypothetical protein
MQCGEAGNTTSITTTKWLNKLAQLITPTPIIKPFQGFYERGACSPTGFTAGYSNSSLSGLLNYQIIN